MALEQLGDGLYVLETPLRFMGVEIGRRMVVVRLPDGGLFVFSPAPRDPAIDALGPVRFVAAASRLHGHLFMEQYGGAELLAAPGLREKRRDLAFAADLGDEPDPRWAGVLDQAVFRGNRYADELVFLHRPTRSLIVGDVVWNVAPPLPLPARVWAGVRPGLRPTPLFRALTRRDDARASAERILRWDFDRVVVGHGPIYETGGRDAFADAWAVT
jgi:hypothetical protein